MIGMKFKKEAIRYYDDTDLYSEYWLRAGHVCRSGIPGDILLIAA